MHRRCVLLLLLLASCHRAPEPEEMLQSIRAERIRAHQTVLAADDMEGRGAGTEGGRKASTYIADQLKAWGFKAAGTDGDWFQPFGEKRRNVLGYWPGSSDEYVVIGAHYDHLGRKGGEVHPGADDNASGSSTVLAIAETLTRSHPLRGVLCVWFDGEENQLAGSRWWTSHPTLPIDRCFAMLNCDMIGRNDVEKIFCGVEKVAGAAKYPKWEAEIKAAEARFGAHFDWTEFDPFIKRSDHWPFMEKGVPAMFFTGGLHPDYHKPGDTLEKINFAKEERVGRIVYSILVRVADRKDPLK